MVTSIFLFLKEPKLGQVKTRLAEEVGDQKAYDIYIQFLKQIVINLNLLKNKQCYIFYDAYGQKPKILKSIFYSHDVFIKQQGKNLGERLNKAFGDYFQTHSEPVIVLGGDSPDLPQSILNQAIFQLSDQEVVIGPSYDGGYYLLGMNYFIPELFQNINWGTATVFSETQKILQSHDKSYFVLPKWFDIDTMEDYKALLNRQN